MELRVNEIYGPVLQGEGVSMGTPVMFIRMAGCNLHCSWCDTSYTWNYEGTQFEHDYAPKVKIQDEVQLMSIDELRDEISKFDCKRIVLSGGEPLIQQKALVEAFKNTALEIECETNGTFMPLQAFDTLITQYNVSPKLRNSGNQPILRERRDALEFFARSPKAWFKYVVSSNDDLKEIMVQIDKYKIPHERVLLMPLGHTKELQEQNLPIVEKICIENGFRLSLRLHVLMHDYQRGI